MKVVYGKLALAVLLTLASIALVAKPESARFVLLLPLGALTVAMWAATSFASIRLDYSLPSLLITGALGFWLFEPETAGVQYTVLLLVHAVSAMLIATRETPLHVQVYTSTCILLATMFLGFLVSEHDSDTLMVDRMEQASEVVKAELLESSRQFNRPSTAASSQPGVTTQQEENLREFLDQIEPWTFFTMLLNGHLIISTLLIGYYFSGATQDSEFLKFRANEKQAPLIILALLGEVLRTYYEFPRLGAYTPLLFYAAASLTWLQALSLCLFMRRLGVVTKNPTQRFLGTLGAFMFIIMPLAGAVTGLVDFYSDFRQKYLSTGDDKEK
jgi:hypothetical protein